MMTAVVPDKVCPAMRPEGRPCPAETFTISSPLDERL